VGRVGRVGKTRIALATLACAVLASGTPFAQVPARVRQLAAEAGVTAPVVASCQGEFRQGQRGHAVAAGGQYLVVDGSGAAIELAPFTDKPDLSCYSRTQARRVHRELGRSGLSGRIAPRFDTTVICGFVDSTTATCWQYSPTERMYVEVGGWTT